MKKPLTYLLCLALVFLPGCQALGMTPQQIQNAKQSLAQQRDVGNISQAQYDAAIEALDEPAGVDWGLILASGASVISSVLLGVPIAVGAVQRKRGPTEFQRQAMRSADKRA